LDFTNSERQACAFIARLQIPTVAPSTQMKETLP
jgi:hypothetical protein